LIPRPKCIRHQPTRIGFGTLNPETFAFDVSNNSDVVRNSHQDHFFLQLGTPTTMAMLYTRLPLVLLLVLPLCLTTAFSPAASLRSPPTALQASPTEQIQNLASSVTSGQFDLNDVRGGAENLLGIVSSGLDMVQDLPLEARLAAVAAAVAAYVVPFLQSPKKPEEATYPEQKAATYDLSKVKIPFEFGEASFVRPLLKQTQIEFRPLQIIYDAKRDGFDPQKFHQCVDGKGASVILCKADGQWFGGYNPRGWASLGGSRPSIAAFLFYKTAFGWQKLRAKGNGGNACSNDLFDRGIYLGSEGLSIPLDGSDPRQVISRLGFYYETGPQDKSTLLRRAGEDARIQELKVLAGVYAKDEDIPNSGGVLDLGLY
jgi:hypothetical protein